MALSPQDALRNAGWYDAEHAALTVGTTVRYLRKLASWDKIPHSKLHGYLYFYIDDLRRFRLGRPNLGTRVGMLPSRPSVTTT